MSTLEVRKTRPGAIIPTRAHEHDAGLDLYAAEDVFVYHGHTAKISTGIAVRIPPGYVGKIEDRGSMSALGLRTGGGVVDAGYDGEVVVVIHNLTCSLEVGAHQRRGYYIRAGNKIAQMLIMPIVTPSVREVEEIAGGSRGGNGFGSTGK